MEKIADKLTQLLIRENVIENSMAEIYRYGLVRMLEIGAAVLTGLAICLGMGMVQEGILFFVFFAPLRSYLGGVHLKKYWQCYLASCMSLIIVLLVTKYAVLDSHIAVALIVSGAAGIAAMAGRERKAHGSSAYAVIIWSVLAVLLLIAGWCFVQGYDSALVLLCCVVLLVLGSKMVEEIFF